MPNRIIKESITTSEKLASLSDFEFRLWIGLITQADDAGRGDARPAVIKGRVFPFRERLTVKDVGSSLRALADKGCVTLYEIGGRPYFYFPNWSKHQRVRDCKPKYPEPTDYSLRQVAADCGEARQSAAIIQSNPIQSESESESEYKGDCARAERKELAAVNDTSMTCQRSQGTDIHSGDKSPSTQKAGEEEKPYKHIVDYLNAKAGTQYKASCKDTRTKIDARLAENFTVEDFEKVIDKKCEEWRGTEWEKFLRPLTLFGPKFESYLNAKIISGNRATAKPNRARDLGNKRTYTAEEIDSMGHDLLGGD